MSEILCMLGFHNFRNYKHLFHPFRAEGTCSRCGKKDVYL